MNWRWEEFTSPDFAEAVAATQGVCLLPIGVMERHSTHLPLGSDIMAVRTVAERAVQQEPAIIFPSYYFGQVHETKNFPGAIAIRRQLLFDLLENVCEEIARNGMKKIILVNGHGGNEYFLQFFAMSLLEKPHDFTVYVARLSDYYSMADDPGWQAMMETPFDWHAGELETSLMLATRADLVQMEHVAPGATPQRRLAHLPKLFTGTFWYADFPDQYAGDAAPATPEKGEYLMSHIAARVATIIKAVREDTVTPALEQEYFARIQH